MSREALTDDVLSSKLVRGLRPTRVVIAEYDPQWPVRFADDPDDEQAFIPDLEAAGYELRVREPGHRCLRIGEPGEQVNLHCYPPEDAEVRKYLIFRDRLRANDADRDLYERTKRKLAEREWPDVNYYAEAKWPVIREILARGGWQE
jgi:hypothetical protein